MGKLLPFPELWPRLVETATLLDTEVLPLEQARGRVLRADAPAAWDLPRFDQAAMDGIAVRAADTARASEARPVELRLVGAAYAGGSAPLRIASGEAARIATGAAIPDGADAIAVREAVRFDGERVWLESPVSPGDHIRRRGEELTRGDEVIPRGQRLTPWALAALRAAGVTEVVVNRAPRWMALATGSELVTPGVSPAAGQIVETNAAFLREMAAEYTGYPLVTPAPVRDDHDDLRQALAAALDDFDLVVTTGGVSVGDRDLVREVSAELGCVEVLWGVAQKPGKPLYLARRGGTVLVGLPGNPAAVGVAWPVVLRPLLGAMEGLAEPLPRLWPVTLGTPVRLDHRHQWLWATISGSPPVATPLRRRGSHMLSDLGRAAVLLAIRPGEGMLAAGQTVEAVAL